VLIYPAIDLMDGRCVRLLKGRFDQATEYDADPFARLAAFAEAGADWVHIVDLDGAKAGAPVQHDLIGRLAATGLARIQTGGGVRTRDDAARLLDAGAARAVIGSAAVRRPDNVRGWIAELGLERVCLALDVQPAGTGDGGDLRSYVVATHGWAQSSGLTLEDALTLYPEGAARHALVTDVSRAGALTGVNGAMMSLLTRARQDLALQASGGVATLADIALAKTAGAAGAIVGRALYEGRFTLKEALDAG
jgi:phosphoribosylformimino-5-aminoimidazole carboxamide ribotide isomerase